MQPDGACILPDLIHTGSCGQFGLSFCMAFVTTCCMDHQLHLSRNDNVKPMLQSALIRRAFFSLEANDEIILCTYLPDSGRNQAAPSYRRPPFVQRRAAQMVMVFDIGGPGS